MDTSLLNPVVWTVFALVMALSIFIFCALYATRIARRLRQGLELHHPEVVARVAPTVSSSWFEHWRWQSDLTVVEKTFRFRSVFDDAVSRDLGRLMCVGVIAFVSQLVLAFSVVSLHTMLSAPASV